MGLNIAEVISDTWHTPGGRGAIIIIMILVTVIIVMAAEIRRQLDRMRRQVGDIEERDATIHNLQTSIALSQIKPHFLYNALNTIYVLCGKDLQKGRQAISDLSDYLRINIGSIDSKLPIPFEKEMEHVKKYLSIEKLRFPEEFTVSYVTPVTDFLLPALTIQPLVENAVRHGVTQNDENGIILITTREMDRYYVVTITDNGPGFDVEKKKEETEGDEEHPHIGIKNVKERLHRLCGGELEIRSTIGYGTEAIIRIPKIANIKNERQNQLP